MPADPLSGEGSLAGLQVAISYLLVVISHGRGQRRGKLSPVSSYKGMNPIHEGST